MKIYLVIRNEFYYPSTGSKNVHKIFTDKDKALGYYSVLCSVESGMFVEVLEIDTDTLTYSCVVSSYLNY